MSKKTTGQTQLCQRQGENYIIRLKIKYQIIHNHLLLLHPYLEKRLVSYVSHPRQPLPKIR